MCVRCRLLVLKATWQVLQVKGWVVCAVDMTMADVRLAISQNYYALWDPRIGLPAVLAISEYCLSRGAELFAVGDFVEVRLTLVGLCFSTRFGADCGDF